MDYITLNWQEITSLLIVGATAALLIKSEAAKYRRKKLGLCDHNSDCVVAKMKSSPQ